MIVYIDPPLFNDNYYYIQNTYFYIYSANYKIFHCKFRSTPVRRNN